MNNVKSLIQGEIEQFKANIEASLYAKLASNLEDAKVGVASQIYNEGACVPCENKSNGAEENNT